VQDNAAVRQFVASFWKSSEMTGTYPATDDILSGALALKTEGDTATRSLSRTVLFYILGSVDSISVREVQALLRNRYSERTAQRYAEAARVASRALSAYLGTLDKVQSAKVQTSVLAVRRIIDAPYAREIAGAEAACLDAPPRRGPDTLEELPAAQRTPDSILRRAGHAT
jgi:hypothetical protein